MPITVEAGRKADVHDAVQVYLRSNLARRRGRPIPDTRIEQVAQSLRDPETWFLLAKDAGVPVGVASAKPSRSNDGAGPLIPGTCFLDLVFVVPERWGEGIGGRLLDAVIREARVHDYSTIHLWTHDDNERSHCLYRSRGFERSGRTRVDDAGGAVGEWKLVAQSTASN